jgi:hypothetical protein
MLHIKHDSMKSTIAAGSFRLGSGLIFTVIVPIFSPATARRNTLISQSAQP